MENIQDNRNILIKASDIIAKCKSKEDRINICRELGNKKFFNSIGYYLPSDNGYDAKFFLQFMAGKKLVSR
jgi:hypothetical protein